jgi:hypothetical protein
VPSARHERAKAEACTYLPGRLMRWQGGLLDM